MNPEVSSSPPDKWIGLSLVVVGILVYFLRKKFPALARSTQNEQGEKVGGFRRRPEIGLAISVLGLIIFAYSFFQ